MRWWYGDDVNEMWTNVSFYIHKFMPQSENVMNHALFYKIVNFHSDLNIFEYFVKTL